MPGTSESQDVLPERSSGIASWFVFVVVCFLVSAIGAAFPPGDWYASLQRPSFAPPNWVFGPVWTLLYLMIATAGWMVWKKRSTGNIRPAMLLFGIQLGLNSLWSYLFFGLHRPDLALVEIAVLWVMILATILAFRPHSGTSAILLVPYLLWVSFAAVLNYGFWSLN